MQESHLKSLQQSWLKICSSQYLCCEIVSMANPKIYQFCKYHFKIFRYKSNNFYKSDKIPLTCESTLCYLDSLCYMWLFPPKINVWILGFQCYDIVLHHYAQLVLNFKVDPIHKSFKIYIFFIFSSDKKLNEVKLLLWKNAKKII